MGFLINELYNAIKRIIDSMETAEIVLHQAVFTLQEHIKNLPKRSYEKRKYNNEHIKNESSNKE
jgi:uncharacterized protein (DUF2384 family)